MENSEGKISYRLSREENQSGEGWSGVLNVTEVQAQRTERIQLGVGETPDWGGLKNNGYTHRMEMALWRSLAKRAGGQRTVGTSLFLSVSRWNILALIGMLMRTQ